MTLHTFKTMVQIIKQSTVVMISIYKREKIYNQNKALPHWYLANRNGMIIEKMKMNKAINSVAPDYLLIEISWFVE